MDAETQQLVTILERLLDGTIHAKEAKARVKALQMAGLEELSGNLFHYIDDADLRERDPGYKQLQDSEMRKLLRHIVAGDLVKANAITFLERTP